MFNIVLETVLYNLTNGVLWGSPARMVSLIRVKLGVGLQARWGDGIGTGHGYLTGHKALLETIKKEAQACVKRTIKVVN